MLNYLHNREKLYWMCQTSGWAFYALINNILELTYKGFDARYIFVYTYLGILGISATHILRLRIKNKKWLTLSLTKLIPKIVLASILSAAFILSVTSLVVFGTGLLELKDFNTGMVMANLVNLSSVVLLWSAIYFFIHYFENLKRSEIERLVWEAAVKDFELKTLKSQLNPHFMFNAMNSIRALIEENPERAKTSLTQLSNIFRYSLRIERTETVPLEDEIKTVEDYLALEKIRYEERLTYSINIDPAIKSIEIPPMMIQTLVENGIKHGISKFPKGGEIFVKANKKDDYAEIIISNTGSLSDEAIKNSKGFGVDNTKQRLNLLYGDKSSFDMVNENGFVNVILKIPPGGRQNESYYS